MFRPPRVHFWLSQGLIAPLIFGWEPSEGFGIFSGTKRPREHPGSQPPKKEHETLKEAQVMDDDVMSNAAYYRSREEAERALAHQAPVDDIRNIHLQLAERYAQLAGEFEAKWQASPPTRVDGDKRNQPVV